LISEGCDIQKQTFDQMVILTNRLRGAYLKL